MNLKGQRAWMKHAPLAAGSITIVISLALSACSDDTKASQAKASQADTAVPMDSSSTFDNAAAVVSAMESHGRPCEDEKVLGVSHISCGQLGIYVFDGAQGVDRWKRVVGNTSCLTSVLSDHVIEGDNWLISWGISVSETSSSMHSPAIWASARSQCVLDTAGCRGQASCTDRSSADPRTLSGHDRSHRGK